MSSQPTPDTSAAHEDSGPANTERFNSVVPDLGSGKGWDHSDLADLLQLQAQPHPDGGFISPRTHVNVNGAVFGGQLIGQALRAAQAAAAEHTPAHSLQVNFLAPGWPNEPLRYQTRELMRGRTFCVQQVIGTQGERVVINATASFQRPETGPRHQCEPPLDVPPPEALPSLREVVQRNAHRVPAAAVRRLGQARVLSVRPVEAEAFLFERDPKARFRYWIKSQNPLPDDPDLHQAALGYLSDYWFALTAMLPVMKDKLGSGLYVASLNHTLWFHHAVRADEWLLVDAHCPFAGSARGLTSGQIFQRDGTLVASLAQEGLYRGWVQTPEGEHVPPGLSASKGGL